MGISGLYLRFEAIEYSSLNWKAQQLQSDCFSKIRSIRKYYAMKKELLIQLTAALLIVLFLYAALSKLDTYAEFRDQLRMHEILKPYAGFISWALPTIEILVSALLFLPISRFAGFIGSLVLMIMFTIYIAGMLLWDSNLPCSCGGVLKHLSWKDHLVFNIFFLALAIFGTWISNSKRVHSIRHRRHIKKENIIVQ